MNGVKDRKKTHTFTVTNDGKYVFLILFVEYEIERGLPLIN